MTSVLATDPGGPRNGLPEFRPYRWRGKPPPEFAARRKVTRSAAARRERRAQLARMRINEGPCGIDKLPAGVLTHEQAARILGVSCRTIQRDLQVLRSGGAW